MSEEGGGFADGLDFSWNKKSSTYMWAHFGSRESFTAFAQTHIAIFKWAVGSLADNKTRSSEASCARCGLESETLTLTPKLWFRALYGALLSPAPTFYPLNAFTRLTTRSGYISRWLTASIELGRDCLTSFCRRTRVDH